MKNVCGHEIIEFGHNIQFRLRHLLTFISANKSFIFVRNLAALFIKPAAHLLPNSSYCRC